MSYQIGIDTIHLRPTPRLAHTDYCSNDALMRHLEANPSALGPSEQQTTAAPGGGGAKQARPFADAWEMDFIWSINDGPVEWSKRGRTTDMGHADFLEGGVDRRQPKTCPFHDVEEVWAFDAIKEYGLPNFDELVAHYEKAYRAGKAANPNQVFTGGTYKTMVSGAIETFGWDMLLEGASDQRKFEAILDSYFRLNLHNYQAWAKTSAEVLICHDDMVWTEGPFMDPAFYRRVIFPRYAELWKPVRAAGKKLLYCSDGNFTPFIDDIFAAGADGLIFEPTTNLDYMVEKYGQSKVIVGSKLDCRTLTFGTPVQIQAEIDATLKIALACPGFMFAVGNHIPSNVPVENALFYFNYLRQ
ncbi:MAG: uroporphyrinogen decarboxylase family protein, partial [Phycisphaerae bacterium]